ncbi:hypothetical protein [Methylophilus luteus]|uniref:Uncharacterized protein n=1 Tax=Methylophilus luteus TaxID=640108 RepID=A0ABW3F9P7_9PROT
MMKTPHPFLALLLVSFLSSAVHADEGLALESESRNVASAFVGAANFVVGRIGIECLALLGRLETPREYVNIWQERNSKYYSASTKYIAKKMEAAEASGGAIARDAVLRDYSTIVRKEGEGIIKDWIGQGNKREGCHQAVMMIDKGILDVSPDAAVYQDIEALAVWSKIN